MSDFHLEIENWIRLAKGDLPGHPFHGNQWTAKQLADAVNEVRRLQNDAYNSDSLDGYDDIVDKHAQIAQAHRVLERRARAEGRLSDADVHLSAAFRHDEAAERNLILHGHVLNDFRGAKQATEDAVNASLDALPLVKSVSEITKDAKGDKCPLCKGTGAIRGGQVTCPKCGGKKVAKGDIAGHAFHGNQYEDAKDAAKLASDANETLRNASHMSELTLGRGRHEDASLAHMDLAESHRQEAKAIEERMKSGEIPMTKFGIARSMITAHEEAAKAHDKAEILNDKATEDNWSNIENSDAAAKASADALDATARATGGDPQKFVDDHFVFGTVGMKKDANESLATILRHDQDHDNWHRMHGDAPCTSEADCAEKRAKYAEVKAEAPMAKSAVQFLGEIAQWQAVQKGDVQGHEFHGNQYTGDHAKKLAKAAATTAILYNNDKINNEQLKTLLQGKNPKPYFKGGAIGEHRDIGDNHRQLREDLEGHPSADVHYDAERAHYDARKAAEDVVSTIDRGGSKKEINSALQNWVSAASLASVGSQFADETTPSDLSKSLSGHTFTKGDVEGHAFHGNQYVSEGNQASEARKLADAVKDGSADHFTAEAHHRNIARACEGASKMASDAGLKRIANAYTKAAQAHREAAASHINSLVVVNSKADPASASEKAALASQKADELAYA